MSKAVLAEIERRLRNKDLPALDRKLLLEMWAMWSAADRRSATPTLGERI